MISKIIAYVTHKYDSDLVYLRKWLEYMHTCKFKECRIRFGADEDDIFADKRPHFVDTYYFKHRFAIHYVKNALSNLDIVNNIDKLGDTLVVQFSYTKYKTHDGKIIMSALRNVITLALSYIDRNKILLDIPIYIRRNGASEHTEILDILTDSITYIDAYISCDIFDEVVSILKEDNIIGRYIYE